MRSQGQSGFGCTRGRKGEIKVRVDTRRRKGEVRGLCAELGQEVELHLERGGQGVSEASRSEWARAGEKVRCGGFAELGQESKQVQVGHVERH